MKMVDGVELLGVREAAVLVGRTPETVRRWVWSGRLTARRDGRRLLLERRDLEDIRAGADRRGGDDGSLTLAEWSALVAERRPAAARGGAGVLSAADLVLEDRLGRQPPSHDAS